MNPKKNILILLLLFAINGLFPYWIKGQENPTNPIYSGTIEESVAKKVDAIFATYDTNTSPGCALSILKDGKLLYQKGYGMANLEYGIAISPSSIFHVASLSKQFTAAVIMRLVLDGKISLSDDIRTYLPEVPNFGHRITFEHLLHHTSGIKDQWDLQKLAGWRSEDLITEEDIMEMVARGQTLNFVPGDEFSYSNTGYTLLGRAVKKITGVSLKDYADSLLFKPLGMLNTHFQEDHAQLIPNRTSAYLGQKGTWRIFLPVYDNYGATGLFTTLEDMAKWDENFYTRKVGGKAWIQALERKGRLNDGTPLIYASGLVVETYKGHQTIGHPGADAGYRSNYLRFPDEHLSIILLANVSDMNTVALSKKVADLFIEDKTTREGKVELTKDSTPLQSWAGLYLDRNAKSTLSLTYQDGQLLKGQDTLAAIDRGTFFDKRLSSFYRFRKEETTPTLEVKAEGYKKISYEKVERISLSEQQLKEYSGEFYSPEIDTKYTFFLKEGALYMKVPRNKEIKLTSLLENMFTAGPILIEFIPSKEKKIQQLSLTMGRTRNVYFHKVSKPL